MNDQPVAANDSSTQPPESREEKRVRLKREREQKKALADERKRAKIAQQAQKKADERNARIKAGEDATAIEEEERVRKLSAEGIEQKRRYSAILLQAQLPLQGVSSKNPEWDDFKEPQLFSPEPNRSSNVRSSHCSQGMFRVTVASVTCCSDCLGQRVTRVFDAFACVGALASGGQGAEEAQEERGRSRCEGGVEPGLVARDHQGAQQDQGGARPEVSGGRVLGSERLEAVLGQHRDRCGVPHRREGEAPFSQVTACLERDPGVLEAKPLGSG
jgi:hypothetical protein